MRREAYIGASEVNQLVGKWQTITGAVPWQTITGGVPWQTITGADPAYGGPYGYGQPPPHHHHHHHHRPWWQQQQQQGYDPYRRAELQHRAYVMGDPVALGALALLGAEAGPSGPGPGAPPPMGPPMPPALPPPMAPPAPVTVAPPAVATPEVPPEHPAHPDHHLPPEHPAHPGHPHHPHHRRYRATGWAPAVSPPAEMWGPPEAAAWPYMIPPRNLLVDRPGPTGADRVILPMSSGVNILPNTSAQITSRPQNYAFRPERVIISGAADWVINDIKVGNMSQFSQSGDVPGEMFGATTIDGFVKFTTCQTAMDFVIVTTFVGASESGSAFVCGVLGTAAVN
jgi:hypothetical protein